MAAITMRFKTFKFFVGGQEKTFSVHYTLPLDILEDAFTNWMERTKKFTAEDFCAYIKSKKTGYRCIPFLQDEKIK